MIEADSDTYACRTLWAAVLASALEDATKKRSKSSLKRLSAVTPRPSPDLGTTEGQKNFNQRVGYGRATRAAALTWMRETIGDHDPGSYGWIMSVLGLEARAGEILDLVLDTPGEIDSDLLQRTRINIRGLIRAVRGGKGVCRK